jgi:hypothetical protein
MHDLVSGWQELFRHYGWGNSVWGYSVLPHGELLRRGVSWSWPDVPLLSLELLQNLESAARTLVCVPESGVFSPGLNPPAEDMRPETAGPVRVPSPASTAQRKTGRPKKEEKDSATKVVAALSAHHGYEEGMSVTNPEPATNRGLRRYGVSGNALTRFLKDKLGEDGHKQYRTACRTGRISVLLRVWRRETPSHVLGLLPHESGSEDDGEQ